MRTARNRPMRQGQDQAAPEYEKIVTRLCSCGYEAYITGGAVRDLLLGKEPLDFDVVTNARPDEIASMFQGNRVEEVGRSFNVTLVNGIEVASYRQDVHHGGEHLDCTASLLESLRQDLEQRDLTFNSMAFCPYIGDLIDPYGGKADLEMRLVRCVGDPHRRILEDPARIVRACRFAANLDGRFEAQTLCALRDMVALTSKVAPERLRLEVKYLRPVMPAKPVLVQTGSGHPGHARRKFLRSYPNPVTEGGVENAPCPEITPASG